MTHYELATAYNAIAHTHNYCFGYTAHGSVFAVLVSDLSLDHLLALTQTDIASQKNGGTTSFKYRQNSDRIALLNRIGTAVKELCTVDHLETLYAESKRNRGQIFEGLVAQAFGMTLEDKENLPFTQGGDATLNGIEYQIKYTRATFSDERTLLRLMNA